MQPSLSEMGEAKVATRPASGDNPGPEQRKFDYIHSSIVNELSMEAIEENTYGRSKKILQEDPVNKVGRVVLVLLAGAAVTLAIEKPDDAPTASVVGYVRDSGCVHRFHEVVKPLPNGCLEACVRAGSPLLILTKNEEVYHPVSTEMPDVDVRSKLLPFAGKLVKVTGKVYERGGSKAITLEHIEEVKE